VEIDTQETVVSGQGFVIGTRDGGAWVGGSGEMRVMERRVLLKKLDKEMRHYRLAAREKKPTNELLRTVRKVLGVPMKEMAEKMGIVESALFQMEDREGTGSITLRSLNRMAGAMGCRVVYGVVPQNGKTLEELAEERLWRDVLGSGVGGVSGAKVTDDKAA
jgi:hypothetical protein